MALAQPGCRLGATGGEERIWQCEQIQSGYHISLSHSVCLSTDTHTHTHTQHTHIKMNKHIIYNQDFSYPWHFPSMNVLQ